MKVADLDVEQTSLERRIEVKRAEVDALRVELAATVAQLVDAETREARAELVQQRLELVVEVDAGTAELGELERRRNAAEVGQYVMRCDEARAELDAAALASRQARRAMQAYSMERLHFLNRGGRAPDTAEAERERIDVDARWARMVAESSIAGTRADRARGRWDKARQELEAARARLGL
jgi:hypothetical protein